MTVCVCECEEDVSGGDPRVIELAVSKQCSQSPLSYKSLFSRLEGFEVSLGARTRHRRSPFKFLVCAILTFSSDQTTTRPTGRTSIHQTTNRSTLSVSNQLLVFYFATVSFSFFCVCLFFVLKIQPLRLRVCVCVLCMCVIFTHMFLLCCSQFSAPLSAVPNNLCFIYSKV